MNTLIGICEYWLCTGVDLIRNNRAKFVPDFIWNDQWHHVVPSCLHINLLLLDIVVWQNYCSTPTWRSRMWFLMHSAWGQWCSMPIGKDNIENDRPLDLILQSRLQWFMIIAYGWKNEPAEMVGVKYYFWHSLVCWNAVAWILN